MNFKLTTRLKTTLLLSLLLISLLIAAVSFDTFGIRSHKPATTAINRNNGGALTAKKTNNFHLVNLPFKVEKPVNLNTRDAFESDFITKLNEIPIRKSNFIGIENRGNSCYADSVIQLLFRIPVVRKIVANLEIYRERAKLIEVKWNNKKDAAIGRNFDLENIFTGLPVIEGLNHMFHQLQSNETKNANFKFANSIQCLPGKFADNKQEDAEEYWTLIMTTLKEIIPSSQHHHLILKVSLNGTLVSSLDPAKTEPRKQLDVETRISLPIQKGVSDLNKLLDTFFAPETLDLNFEDEIKTPGKLIRAKRLENLPEIIAIHLQRLSVNYDSPDREFIKMNDPVKMPDEIDFAKYIGTNLSSKATNYRLKMFVVHSGGSGGGHYYAYARNNSSSWYTLNDAHIALDEDPDEFKKDRETGYLYFYEKSHK